VTGSRNYANIAPPSATLHVSNVPVESTEDDIKALFAQHGAVSTIKIIPYVDSRASRKLDDMRLLIVF
jgi:polypyrimidine tract-binding protein 2